MTVPAATRRSSVFTGNAVATAFPFTFKIFANTDIQVLVTSVAGVISTAVLGSDYTVAVNVDQTVAPGGAVNYLVAPATGVKVVVIGALPYSQTLSLPGGGNFNPAAIENAFDRTEIQIQQLAASLDGSIKTPVGELAPALPAAAQRANRLLGFDSLGNPSVFAPADGSATALALDLASSVTPSKGAGQLGFSSAVVYPVGTIGKRLNDLASATGSALIGWIRSATGAITSTVADWLGWQAPSVLEFMTSAQRADVLTRTGAVDVTAAIQAAIDAVYAAGGGSLRFPSGVYRVSGTIDGRSYMSLLGEYGENAVSPLAEAGTKFKWVGSASGTVLRFYNARLFKCEGFIIDGGGMPGVTGILLDSNNVPSGSQNEFRRISIRECFVGMQWGTSGIAGGSYANDGTLLRTFTIWSNVAGSIGIVMNSGNAGQMSRVENGGIQCQALGIDIKIANQVNISQVFGGAVMDIGFIRLSVGIDTVIEKCASECWGVGKTVITNRPSFLIVVPPVEAYPMMRSSITLYENHINNPIRIQSPVRITSLADAWGFCQDYTTAVVGPAAAIYTAAAAGSRVMSLNNGVDPAQTGSPTAEPTQGWVQSPYAYTTRSDPGLGWIAPLYNGAIYTSSSGTWVVDSGDVETFCYLQSDRREMTVAWKLNTTTVTGAPAVLQILLPLGLTASRGIVNTCRVVDNGTASIGFCYASAGSNQISIQKVDGSAFAASANNTTTQGQITFETT